METQIINIKVEDILPFSFFQYGKPYTGSCQGMHFRIAREPMENTFFDKNPDKDKDAKLMATIWRGPYNSVTTTEEKTVELFEYSNEGRMALIEWLEAKYIENAEFWKEGTKLK